MPKLHLSKDLIMSEFVYLMKNGDLYKLGCTSNLESEASIWERHPSRSDIHGTNICKSCSSPTPIGELKRWGKCSFCRRKELKIN